MTDDEGVRSAIARAGFQVIEAFDLPDADWWDEYYHPLEHNLSALAEKYSDVPEAAAVLEGTRTEIAMRRNHSAHYNYRFYCLERA